jgi:hypothetical protein
MKGSEHMGFIVFNPTSGPSLKEIKMAPRNKKLTGSVIGLVDNGKKNSDVVIQRAATMLIEKYAIKELVIHKKPSFSHGLTQEEAAELADKCDFILTGVGD